MEIGTRGQAMWQFMLEGSLYMNALQTKMQIKMHIHLALLPESVKTSLTE